MTRILNHLAMDPHRKAISACCFGEPELLFQ
jgi:hypothetical protein